MLFTYWTNVDAVAPPAAAAWKAIYRDFTVFGDADVMPLLHGDLIGSYPRIRLPAAKSDIARMLLLRRYGGLYVDAHVGPTAPGHLLETLDRLSAYELLLFGKGWAMQEAHDFDLMNGIVAARKGSPLLDQIIERIAANVARHAALEQATTAYVPYDLFSLTGTYVLVNLFFDLVSPRPELKDEFRDSVFVHFMKDNISSGFEIAAFYNYRRPGRHWSERQKSERFFIE